MGLYLRRSVRVGPIRFNFSTSGIGVSAGIPGFRVGTGPRGAYVHMGAGGLYYRQSLGSPGRTDQRISSNGARRSGNLTQPGTEIPDATVGQMEEIDSGAILELTDSSSQALLEEVQRCQATPRLALWVPVGVGLIIFGLWIAGLRGLPLAAPLIPGCLAYWWASGRDAIRRSVIVGYELDPEAARAFEGLLDAIKALGSLGGLWHVNAQAQVQDGKYHAGASRIIKRDATRPGIGQPPIIRTNLDVPSLKVGEQQLYFFPDRLLVFERSQVGAVGYDALSVDVDTTRFIEEDRVPPDAQIVDRTWRYVNKKGGPDRRFASNRELPVALYETIHFRSASGLNELLHASRIGIGRSISEAVTKMALLSRPAAAPASASPTVNAAAVSPPSLAARIPRTPEHLPPSSPKTAARPDQPNRLRRGAAAETIAERGQAWEYRGFALALIDAMTDQPEVPVIEMPADLSTRQQVAEWASAQLQVPIGICTTLDHLVNIDLQKALGPPGKPGDSHAILDVAWNIGLQAARGRAWSIAVWTTPVPRECISLREELARTLDQPLREIAAFGPNLLASIEKALNTPHEGAARTVKMTLTLELQNEQALRRAIETALR